MSTIFPGMDPYLEDPLLWRGAHIALMVYIADQLQPLLRPRYVASVERRTFWESASQRVSRPKTVVRRRSHLPEGDTSYAQLLELDEPFIVADRSQELGESYIEILDLRSGQKLVTLIEVTSPTNKANGPGRDSYLAKQGEVRGSPAHLVEIDLLRGGMHVLAVPEGAVRNKWLYDYLISVNRAGPDRSLHDVYPRLLRQRLPRIRIPLADGDPDVRLDVQAAIAQVYEAGCYRDRIDYSVPCEPPLSAEDQAWAFELAAGATSS